jgi:phosphohistidine swiveling domain-containing protein
LSVVEGDLVVAMEGAAPGGVARVGAKAASLARLSAAGFSVPAGFVVTADAFVHLADAELAGAIEAAAAPLGDGPFAVRSSAVGEDAADASYAGLYETYLNVHRSELIDAVRRCREAGGAPRVAAYQVGRGAGGKGTGMAVLVQTMVPAQVAGVAFTADPVTGDRAETVITAARGLGERLVSGGAVGDEWVLRDGRARCRRSTEAALDAGLAAEVADLARAVEAHLAVPQDIEWAYADGKLWLLQARPMTALPEPVDWSPPGPGVWLRNIRLGEWLPDPTTPLFADWLLPRINDGVAQGMRDTAGVVVPFRHASVNGWYYTTPIVVLTPTTLIRGLTPSYIRGGWFMYRAVHRAMYDPIAAESFALGRLYRHWRDRLLPNYQRLVADSEAQLDSAAPTRLVDLVNQITHTAGVHMWYILLLGGSAWKMETALTRFTRRHLPGILPDGVPVLLAGLPGTDPLLRRIARRLGHSLTAAESIDAPEDLFFLTYPELEAGLDGDASRRPDAAGRRATWERQRRLAAPLQLGRTPRFVPALLAGYGVGHRTVDIPDGGFSGQAASPGRATGPARILGGPDDFHRLQPGEILVASTTTPAWTPLFNRAAAVVTDGGNRASHASLIAREYGIPAVVGAGHATRQLYDGQTITVDGTTGTVTSHVTR